ncbi:MAG: DEAD/DEAH box helicase, partial [Afipia sp.]
MFKLRDYQVNLKNDIYSKWAEGHQNVLAVMPTGMGKTVTFCSIALDALHAGTPTVIAVHRTELVEQISLTLAGVGITHNIIAPRPVIVGIVSNHRLVHKKQFYDYNSNVTVVSVDTLNARAERHEQWAKKIKLWIIDEAAHVLRDNKWGRAVHLFPGARGLGVTATPQRLDKRGLGKHADGVFDVMVQGPTSAWGIQAGYLCRYKIACPISDYKNHLRKATEGSDYSKESMKLASLNSTIIGDVVREYMKHARGKQAILFSCDISEGSRMEAEFGKVGIIAKLLTGETDIRERRRALLDYRDRKIHVLINVDLFDE